MFARLIAAIALVGCYRPSTEPSCSVACGTASECPSGLACNPGGFCTPGAVSCSMIADAADLDAVTPPRDAESGCSFTDPPTFVTTGSSFTSYGVYQAWYDGTVYVKRGNSMYEIGAAHLEPKLAPSGNEILMIDGTKAMFQTTWNGSAWTAPAPLTTNIPVSPGTVTTETPRVMYATTNGRIYRGVESTGTWMFDSLGTFGLAVASDPSIDPTGKRMVFVGRNANNETAIYITFADGDGGWLTPQLLYDDPAEERTPYVSPDCKRLYYSVQGSTYLAE